MEEVWGESAALMMVSCDVSEVVDILLAAVYFLLMVLSVALITSDAVRGLSPLSPLPPLFDSLSFLLRSRARTYNSLSLSLPPSLPSLSLIHHARSSLHFHLDFHHVSLFASLSLSLPLLS